MENDLLGGETAYEGNVGPPIETGEYADALKGNTHAAGDGMAQSAFSFLPVNREELSPIVSAFSGDR